MFIVNNILLLPWNNARWLIYNQRWEQKQSVLWNILGVYIQRFFIKTDGRNYNSENKCLVSSHCIFYITNKTFYLPYL